jgi:hypothetical protein
MKKQVWRALSTTETGRVLKEAGITEDPGDAHIFAFACTTQQRICVVLNDKVEHVGDDKHAVNTDAIIVYNKMHFSVGLKAVRHPTHSGSHFCLVQHCKMRWQTLQDMAELLVGRSVTKVFLMQEDNSRRRYQADISKIKIVDRRPVFFAEYSDGSVDEFSLLDLTTHLSQLDW